MPVLKAHVDGQWVPLVAGRDGAQGPPGPASPHEGSHIAISVRQYGAKGDGSTDDTAAVQAAISAAGAYGWVDFEAGTYKVTGNLANYWKIRKTGPGVITDGSVSQYVAPRYYGDYLTIFVNSSTGDSVNDGLSPSRPLKSLADLNGIWERIDSDQVQRGRIKVRLTGTFDGVRFQNLPRTGLPVEFEGDALADGAPITKIKRTSATIGVHVEPATGRQAVFRNLAFEGFTGSNGFGLLWSQGGSVRIEDCTVEDCGVGIAVRDNASMSILRSKAKGCTISGFRAQYSASGTWHQCEATFCNEGFHISRNSVMHADYINASDNTRDGVWVDMSSRVAIKGAATIHRNGREGARAEGGSDLHLDESGGVIDFGTGTPNANTRRGWGLYGTARLTADGSIYGANELLMDSFWGSRTGGWTAQRGINADHCGQGARSRTVVTGQGAGSIEFRIGASTYATVSVPAGDWKVEAVAMYDGSAWQGYTTAGSSTTIQSLSRGRLDSSVTVIPTGTTVRGIEAWVAG